MKLQNQLFQQAKQMVGKLTNQNSFNEQDKEVARQAIQAAYTNATAEEQQELQQLEQQLAQENELK
ncbi:uncharacterized protein DUF3813 [Saliterribacillus persicus]|uniref:Uncharacterized protein DUF3813 n=1 Tax=Saliterribacillus persicus TaxID=930114 RepID=A0A368XNZ4_9BACI|nr:uncharacterized protein DUF3813 [Saliterribacillus persicus]